MLFFFLSFQIFSTIFVGLVVARNLGDKMIEKSDGKIVKHIIRPWSADSLHGHGGFVTIFLSLWPPTLSQDLLDLQQKKKLKADRNSRAEFFLSLRPWTTGGPKITRVNGTYTVNQLNLGCDLIG